MRPRYPRTNRRWLVLLLTVGAKAYHLIPTKDEKQDTAFATYEEWRGYIRDGKLLGEVHLVHEGVPIARVWPKVFEPKGKR